MNALPRSCPLPPEITELVTLELANSYNKSTVSDYQHTLRSCFFTCKSFYHAARKLFFADIYLPFHVATDERAARLWEIFEANPSLALDVRILRLELHNEDPNGDATPPILPYRNKNLSSILRFLSRGQVQSLVVKGVSTGSIFDMGGFDVCVQTAFVAIRAQPSLKLLHLERLINIPGGLLTAFPSKDGLKRLVLKDVFPEVEVGYPPRSPMEVLAAVPTSPPRVMPLQPLESLTIDDVQGLVRHLRIPANTLRLPHLRSLTLGSKLVKMQPDKVWEFILAIQNPLEYLSLEDAELSISKYISTINLALLPSLRTLRLKTFIWHDTVNTPFEAFSTLLNAPTVPTHIHTILIDVGWHFALSDQDHLVLNQANHWLCLDHVLAGWRYPDLREVGLILYFEYEGRLRLDGEGLGRRVKTAQDLAGLLFSEVAAAGREVSVEVRASVQRPKY